MRNDLVQTLTTHFRGEVQFDGRQTILVIAKFTIVVEQQIGGGFGVVLRHGGRFGQIRLWS
jgi:hypothetical protein